MFTLSMSAIRVNRQAVTMVTTVWQINTIILTASGLGWVLDPKNRTLVKFRSGLDMTTPRLDSDREMCHSDEQKDMQSFQAQLGEDGAGAAIFNS